MPAKATAQTEEQRRMLAERLPAVIGHRGAALHAPENTLASMLTSLELGASWVEVDVKLSADAIPFLLHDATLDRTTNGSGKGSGLKMHELAKLDAGSWFSSRFANERLPTLIELIELLDQNDMGLNLEIKPTPGSDIGTTEVIIATLRKFWPESRPWPLISSFSRPVLARAFELAPDIPRGLLLETLEPDWRDAMTGLGCATLHIDHEAVTDELCASLRGDGIPLLVYTVNDGALGASLLARGATSIISDAPERILAVLGR